MKYRREIDGLRAVAVLPVILFHAGFNYFEGGFVGVDVFFVISGYLITTIILADMNNGTFSIVTFYERRARRILPVLFFVMFCCLPFAWLWLLPTHLKDFSKSLTAVSLFSSNIFFWKGSGYFDTAAELKPLLHTWSLAVEEQYYILFPLFLLALWKLRKRWIFGILIALALISLTMAHIGAYSYPSATFYLLPTRGWELAIGAIIAFYFLYKRDQIEFIRSNKSISEAFSFIGLSLICYSIFAFNKSTPFPSIYALIPTVGAALIIIFSTVDTTVGRLLSSKLMVGIGLLSYSAYLWHQPLFVFARYRSMTEPGVMLLVVLSCLSIVFAYFSWRYIEIPFRDKKTFGRKKIFCFAVVGSIFFAATGFAGRMNKGWAGRIPSDLNMIFNNAIEISPIEKLCQPPIISHAKDSYVMPDNAKRYVYLIGDSHAGALASTLQHGIEDLRINNGMDIGFMAFVKNGCPPVTKVYRSNGEKGEEVCKSHNDDVYSYISSNNSIEYIVMSTRWTLNYVGDRFNNFEGGIEYGGPANLVVVYDDIKYYNDKKLISERYTESIKYLINLGKKVILVYPIPEVGWNVPDYFLKYSFSNKIDSNNTNPVIGSTSYDVFVNRNNEVYNILDSIGEHPNLFRVYPDKIFCNTFASERCSVQNNGQIFYRDDDHPSLAGSKLIVDEIIKHIK